MLRQMSKHLLCGLFLAMLIVGSSISGDIVNAGPLEDGVAAYRRSDFATALRLLRPLADQGDAVAQARLGLMYEGRQGRAAGLC
jgi:TPR repeat protein